MIKASNIAEPSTIDPEEINVEYQLATDFVKFTNRSLFLTGKAGTGKTTFLKQIKNTTSKNTVVLAPTGVAAINAGGTTIHSFFQLPFGPFIPISAPGFAADQGFADKHSIFKNIRFTRNKIQILLELDLLIIDEVSMVRCDVIDGIDAVLRHFRKQPFLPFGGVQLLFIGDLFQLPPVMPENEWKILSQFYDSPYFFSSRVTQQYPPLYLELKKIYRQNEQVFIDILNRVRTNEVAWDDLQVLHECYDPSFQPTDDGHYIILSTHNRKVEAINVAALEKLTADSHAFQGTIKGDFSEKALPTDLVLYLKVGAQVMFIKNDADAVKRYYNGKIGKIKSIENGEITVEFPETNLEMVLERVSWENINYVFDNESGEIKEKVEGTFTQYPIKLAWAITVHKSQGLTFERAIIDLGSSFAPGQVYVALSRCISLKGMILHSRIPRHCIMTDEKVVGFALNESGRHSLHEQLETEIQSYRQVKVLLAFQFTHLMMFLEQFRQNNKLRKNDIDSRDIFLSEELIIQGTRLKEVADKFQIELSRLLKEYYATQLKTVLIQRMDAASQYFIRVLQESFLKPVRNHRKSLPVKKRLKKYIKELQALESYFSERITQMKEVANLLN